jgi:hypothetical protein
MVQTASAFPIASALPGACAGPACPTTRPAAQFFADPCARTLKSRPQRFALDPIPWRIHGWERRAGAAVGATKGATGSTARSVGRPCPARTLAALGGRAGGFPRLRCVSTPMVDHAGSGGPPHARIASRTASLPVAAPAALWDRPAHPERIQRRGLAAVHSALHMADTIGAGVGSLVGWAPLRGGRIISAVCALRRAFSASVINLMRASSQASMDSNRV